MSNRLSHSSVAMYSDCGRKYNLWYNEKLRPTTTSGALLFGSALDHALNVLLKENSLEEATKMFEKSFRFQNINNEGTYLPKSTKVVYSERDFDYDLLDTDDIDQLHKLKIENNMYQEATVNGTDTKYASTIKSDIDYLRDKKKSDGIKSFTSGERQLYALANWLCLRHKGHLMLKEYNSKIMPKIKKVLEVQKTINIENNVGDSILGYVDLIVEWEDGKRYILDNKTSTREYEPDSAMRSQQLIIYYHALKEEYKLDGVGFIVLYKTIDKNKTKQCSVCGKDGTGQRHKTCDNMTPERCNGAWIETIKPKAFINTIFNEVPGAAEDLVIQTFDEANEGIKNKTFNPNLKACGSHKDFLCAYYNHCWKNDDSDLVQLGETK